MQDFTLKHHQANKPKKVQLNNKISWKNRVNGYLSIFFHGYLFSKLPRMAECQAYERTVKGKLQDMPHRATG